MIRPCRSESSRMPARARSSASGSAELGQRPTRRGRRAMKQLVMVAALVAPPLVAAQIVFAAPPDPVDFTITPTDRPLVGDRVDFTASPNPPTDPDGDITEVAWDFDYKDGVFTVDA